MTIYCFDTSAFIAAYVENYPPDVTPRLWNDLLPALIEEGRLVTPKDVLIELERKAGKDHGLFEWVKDCDAVHELDDLTLVEVARITNAHRRLIEHKPGRSGADPIVIAMASVKGAVVVTKEGLSGNVTKPKIPDVCKAEGIEYMGLLEVIRSEKWVFA